MTSGSKLALTSAPSPLLTVSAKAEWSGYGVKPVQAEGHQRVGGSVSDHPLSVAHDLTADIAGVPVDSVLPDDVRQYVD